MLLKSFYSLVVVLVSGLVLVPLVTAAYHVAAQPQMLALLVDKDVIAALVNTLTIASAALLVSMPVAVILSWSVVRTNILGRSLFRNVLVFPYYVPCFLLAVSWITLAAPRVGILSRLFPTWRVDLYNWWGLVGVFSAAYLPLILSGLCNAFDDFDPSLEEAARIAGAGPMTVLWRITLPLMIPVIATSGILFFLAILSAFGLPAVIGTPARIGVLTTKIYEMVRLGGVDGVVHGFVLALWLLVLTAGLLFVGERIQRNNRYRLVVGKVSRASVITLGVWRGPLTVTVLLATCVLVVLPLSALVASSFLVVAGDFSRFTLRNYSYLWAMPELTRAFLNSFVLCLVTAAVCSAVGFAIGYFRDRTQLPGRQTLFLIATLGYSLPGTLIALAVIVSYGTGWGIESIALYGSVVLLVFAYAAKYMALSAQSLLPAIANVDHSLDDAARLCGATWPRVLAQIVVPLVRSSVISVFVLTAVPVFTELTMSALLVGPGTETVGTLLFQLQDYANPLSACALSTILIALLAVCLPLVQRAQGRGWA
ncbi:MAG: iron ABC transporter permease [Deltaproteobacteria bacterium]|nr:iron ABC transporter permease [Deltaproteobacteria bacterium]